MAGAVERSDPGGGDPRVDPARSGHDGPVQMPAAEPAGGLAGGPAAAADRYWSAMDRDRTVARSIGRAGRALGLLAGAEIRSGKLLDVGCGPGWAMERFREAGFDVRGVEISPAAAAEAQRRGFAVDVVDVETGGLGFDPDARFDAVTALEVLEHVRDPLRLIRAMTRVLSPGGKLVVSLPNELHVPRRLAILIGLPQAAGHRQFGGHDDPHVRFFTPRLARRLFEAAALRELACAWDGMAPARWGFLKGLSDLLARVGPSGFALSGLYLLEPEVPR